jgi:hypothetical protein
MRAAICGGLVIHSQRALITLGDGNAEGKGIN